VLLELEDAFEVAIPDERLILGSGIPMRSQGLKVEVEIDPMSRAGDAYIQVATAEDDVRL
jgi:hypothetical protein